MVRRSLTHRALLAAALLLAAACGDDGVSPAIRAEQGTPLMGVHTGKYRDSGVPHATGRSGTARLSARALLRADGLTQLVITTGSLNALAAAPGELSKVQLKVFAADGKPLFTQNHQRPSATGTATFLLPGLARGQTIQVQANVRGIDGRRTDVVTVTAEVAAAPALRAEITPPSQAVVGVPTAITAIVRETGGDAGAWSDCVLYVNGVEVDRAPRVWVDAGDEVTCVFSHTFTGPGAQNLEVRLEGGSTDDGLRLPGAGASATVDAVLPVAAPSYRARVEDRTARVTTRFDYSWRAADGSHQEYESSETTGTRSQTLTLAGTLARATVFPLARVELSIASDAAEWQNTAWEAMTPAANADGALCADRLVPEHGGHFSLCSTGQGAAGGTVFSYTRFAGTVTYLSTGFGRRWDNVAAKETYWTWNSGYEQHNGGGQAKPLGGAVTFRLRVADGLGSWQVNPTVPLTPFETVLGGRARSCEDDAPYWLWGGTRTTCTERDERATGWAGEVTG